MCLKCDVELSVCALVRRRMMEMVQVMDQLRLQLKDVEARVGSHGDAYLNHPNYESPVETRDMSESEDLFLA